MTAQHTKLRLVGNDDFWSASRTGYGTTAYQVIKDEFGETLALAVGHTREPFAEPNLDHGRRLVACWNALADLPQDALDGGWTRAGLEAYGLRMEKERDELLAALQATTAWMERLRASGDAGNWDWSEGDEYSQGIAAIQKATNKEQA